MIWASTGVIISMSVSALTLRTSFGEQPKTLVVMHSAVAVTPGTRIDPRFGVVLDPGDVGAGTSLDRSPPRAITSSLGEGVLRIDGATEIDQAEDEQEQDRQHQAELDQGLTAIATAEPMQQRAHQLSTWIVVVRHGRSKPAVSDCEATL